MFMVQCQGFSLKLRSRNGSKSPMAGMSDAVTRVGSNNKSVGYM